jgi:hypothetical protein
LRTIAENGKLKMKSFKSGSACKETTEEIIIIIIATSEDCDSTSKTHPLIPR